MFTTGVKGPLETSLETATKVMKVEIYELKFSYFERNTLSERQHGLSTWVV